MDIATSRVRGRYFRLATHNLPESTIVGALLYLMLPVLLPVASIDLITFLEDASLASPKTTCFPLSQVVTTVVMKNWEPLLHDHVSKVLFS